jgi:hypothetical protein
MAVLESAPLLPEGVAEQYRGKWIAIRDREVVAVADSLEELYAHDGVDVGDVIYRVPKSAYHYHSVA